MNPECNAHFPFLRHRHLSQNEQPPSKSDNSLGGPWTTAIAAIDDPVPIPVPDRYFHHLLPKRVAVRGCRCYRRGLTTARQTLPDGQDAVDNDGVDALLDLAL